MPKKLGLRVKHSATVAKVTPHRCHRTTFQPMPEGWYVWVKVQSQWRALTDLRFVREKDAVRAAQSLTAAGLDTAMALKGAGVATVKQVATEFLQW
jgi:hypothetical protein